MILQVNLHLVIAISLYIITTWAWNIQRRTDAENLSLPLSTVNDTLSASSLLNSSSDTPTNYLALVFTENAKPATPVCDSLHLGKPNPSDCDEALSRLSSIGSFPTTFAWADRGYRGANHIQIPARFSSGMLSSVVILCTDPHNIESSIYTRY